MTEPAPPKPAGPAVSPRAPGDDARLLRRGRLGGALVFLALVLLWALAWWMGRIVEYAPHASLWFPPAGLTFAAFLVLGTRAIPPVAVAATLVTLSLGAVYGRPFPVRVLLLSGFLFALAHGTSYGLGAWALRRWGGGGHGIPVLVTAYLLVAPASAFLAAVGGISALVATGLATPAEGKAILLPWWLGDFGAVVSLGPAFALALEALARFAGIAVQPFTTAAARLAPAVPGASRLPLKLAACLLPLGLSLAVVRVTGPDVLPPGFLVFFAIVPLMWIAYTEGAPRTFRAVAGLSVAIAAADGFLGPGDHTTTYQFAMIVLAGSAYFGLSVPALYVDNVALRRLATTDALTGAQTRSFFLEAAARELDRARRFRTPLSLLAVDLDRFKAINDTHGHLFGDAVLQEVGRRLLRELRASDALGRLGGDELAVLLPMADLAAARETAERLAEALRALPVGDGGREVAVTASFGAAQADPAGETLEQLLERADRAMYAAKLAGRDRVAASSAGA